MPSRNTIKEYAPDSYYHVYNRGVAKQKIFRDEQDYSVFLNLLKRYLSKESTPDSYGRDGVTFYSDIELLAYCLMPNHYHLLIFVGDNSRALAELMQRVSTSYTMYFNKKYTRVGHLFQGRYKASRITDDAYLTHISRYIHRNPEDYLNWPYSSLSYYIKDWKAEWVRPQKIYDLYEWGTYEAFLNDDRGYEESLEDYYYDLADSVATHDNK